MYMHIKFGIKESEREKERVVNQCVFLRAWHRMTFLINYFKSEFGYFKSEFGYCLPKTASIFTSTPSLKSRCRGYRFGLN